MDGVPNATLVGTVRDKGPYLLEWISYYKMIGFERVFGNGGVTQFEDEPIIAQFIRSAPHGPNRLKNYSGFKTMFRPQSVRRLGVHRPKHASRFREGTVPMKWVNGSSEEMPAQFITQG